MDQKSLSCAAFLHALWEIQAKSPVYLFVCLCFLHLYKKIIFSCEQVFLNRSRIYAETDYICVRT